jgi:hypothetical protein
MRDLGREHLPPKNSERAELVLELPSRHPRIQVPDVQAGHRSRSPANHPPQTDTETNQIFREASEKIVDDESARQNQTTKSLGSSRNYQIYGSKTQSAAECDAAGTNPPDLGLSG